MLELQNPIIAGVRKESDFNLAVQSPVSAIFLLKSDVMTLRELINNKQGKKVFVHIDMAEGVGKDKKGIELLKSMGVDGVITTKNHLVHYAKEQGLCTVQRFFIVDSAAIATAMESISNAKPDYAELLPGTLPKVIKTFVEQTKTEIISGGLIEDKKDVISALNAGACAVSTGKKELWNI